MMTGTRVWRFLLAAVLVLELVPTNGRCQALSSDFPESRMMPSLEVVLQDREIIRTAIGTGHGDERSEGRTYVFNERIPLAEGWQFLRGGSFGFCSDDITVFALHHPGKDILRILHAQYTGTVDGGRFLIDRDGRRIIVSPECLGNDPPRRFVIRQGIPCEDAAFHRAFAEAFRRLAVQLRAPIYRYYYTRSLSFHGRGRSPRVDLKISRADGDSPEIASTVAMIYDEAAGRVSVLAPAP